MKIWLGVVGMLVLAACSSSEQLAEDTLLLHSVKVQSDSKEVNVASLEPYVRQRPTVKWFVLKKDVPLDTMLTRQSCEDLLTAMQNMGYMNAQVSMDTIVGKKHKVDLVYNLSPGQPFFIRSIRREIADSEIEKLLLQHPEVLQLEEGMIFSVNELNNERKRITSLLNNNGYFKFHKEYIRFTADSTRGSRMVDLTMHLMPYKASNDAPEVNHPNYTVRNVTYTSGDEQGNIHLRPKVLQENTWISENAPYSANDLQKTYNHFGKLSAVKYTNIRFSEVPDTTLLDCNIQVSTNKPNTLSFQPEGTNTAGDLGAAASLTYENRNLFRGSETFSIQLRGAFEAITGLEGYQNQDYEEYNVEAKLTFPRFIAPFISKSYRRRSTAISELMLSHNLQNRPEFHRRLFNAAWRYRWSDASTHTSYRADVIDLNYIYMPWISPTFKHDYLDSVSNRNAILRYNYADLFIMKIGFSLSYAYGNHAFKANVETAGNLLNATSNLFGSHTNEHGQHTLFNIAFAQYAKADFDYVHTVRFSSNNELALHAGFGIAYPYGNSQVLPFEKRYFSGGANSVRGWSVRGLGPGKFHGNNGAIDFINQTGDMKLDLNMEYRTFLFWKLMGAVFIDAGNIWTLRAYDEQPGGQFKFDEFYKQIAVAYGVGLRLNFGYFILRFDAGMKAINPAYESDEEHWAIVHPKLSRDFAFHFAVGLPF
ncbi:MAG: BamA/TamA family outer membrane protein [Prevotella sp.]|nr:BamA/TamA family outer membrane protein [Prevotella sp.]